jgi:uncharacterized protein YwgA
MANVADVVRIARLNGGRIIGKTRFQKTAYFLERLGIGFGFEFYYHHFGPYSEELADLADDAKALKILDVNLQSSKDGAEYAVFSVRDEVVVGDEHARLDELRRVLLQILNSYSAVELELAATADYLEENGYKGRGWDETRQRKALKVSEERIVRAQQLLQDLRRVRL